MANKLIRELAVACATLVVTAALCGTVAAAEFPNKPVQLVVPWKTGGGTDRNARLMAPYLSQALGVPVQVVNIAGGSGWIAWEKMANWDPEADDHKIGFVNLPHIFAYLDPRMGRSETWQDFNFVSGQSFDPCTWIIRPDDERYDSLDEFIDYVKAHPDEITVSTTAIGSDDYQGLAYAEKKIEGFQVSKVYANNDAKKVQELLGEHTDMLAGNVSYYVPYINDGRMQALAVLSEERSHYLPEVPTFQEITGIDNICYSGRTLVAAPGLAPEKYQVYLEAIKQVQQNPEYIRKAKKNNITVWKIRGDELKEFIKDTEERVKEIAYWKEG